MTTFTDTEKMALIDKGVCENFLRWIADNSGDPTTSERYHKILTNTFADPLKQFQKGMQSVCDSLMRADENPLERFTINPQALFQVGLSLGYAMAIASGDPEFSIAFEKLKSIDENVTHISKARKA